MTKKTSWNKWELVAIKYLQNKWYKIIETNYCIKWSEIDIIWQLWEKVVFFEVKYRSNNNYWTWEDSITFYKQKSLLRWVKTYCYNKKINEDNIQVDLIVINKWFTSYNLKHYKNIEIN